MTRHIKITSHDKIVFEKVIENCNDCPCYDDGACGEYKERCLIDPFRIDVPWYQFKGIASQCPLMEED